MIEESYKIRVVSQQQRGNWTTCDRLYRYVEGYVEDDPSEAERPYKDHVGCPSQSLQPIHVVRPRGHLPSMQLSEPGLQHIIFGCKATLMQGQYGKHHEWGLCKLAEILEACRLKASRVCLVTSQQLIQFIRHGARLRTAAQEHGPSCPPELSGTRKLT